MRESGPRVFQRNPPIMSERMPTSPLESPMSPDQLPKIFLSLYLGEVLDPDAPSRGFIIRHPSPSSRIFSSCTYIRIRFTHAGLMWIMKCPLSECRLGDLKGNRRFNAFGAWSGTNPLLIHHLVNEMFHTYKFN